MQREHLDPTKNMLLLVRFKGEVHRAVVTDSFWFDQTDLEPDDPHYGRFEVVLGALQSGSIPDGLGDEETLRVADVVAVVELHRERFAPHHDALAFCRDALTYCETQYAKAPWDEVLGKPWNWAREAWLGGHDVPCELDNIQD